MDDIENGEDRQDEDEILSLRESIRVNTHAIRRNTLEISLLRQDFNGDRKWKIPLWTHVVTMVATIAIMAAAHVVMLGQAMGQKYFMQESYAQDK